MSTPTRFPKGVSTQEVWQVLGNYGSPDPAKFHTYFNDFDTLSGTDFTITTVGTSSTALVAGAGGLIRSSTSAGATDAEYLQLVAAGFTFTPATSSAGGLKALFRIKLQVSDATNSAIHAGLINTTATPQAPQDGLFFLKASGATTFILRSMVGGVATDLALTGFNFANATDIELGFYFDGKTTVYAYVNDFIVSTNPSAANKGAIASFTPTLTTANLAPSFGILNGAGAIKTLTVDHVFAAVER